MYYKSEYHITYIARWQINIQLDELALKPMYSFGKW